MVSSVNQMKVELSKELANYEADPWNNNAKGSERVLDLLERLAQLQITSYVLEQTLVGTVVSKFKKSPDRSVATAARLLVRKWRGCVKEDRAAHNRKETAPTQCVNVKVKFIRPRYGNLADWAADSEHNVYIGRGGVVFVDGKRFPPRNSEWCNPFHLKGSTREKVIRDYEDHMRARLAREESLAERLVRELKGKRLGCWCKPQACHGDVLIKLIKELSAPAQASPTKGKIIGDSCPGRAKKSK